MSIQKADYSQELFQEGSMYFGRNNPLNYSDLSENYVLDFSSTNSPSIQNKSNQYSCKKQQSNDHSNEEFNNWGLTNDKPTNDTSHSKQISNEQAENSNINNSFELLRPDNKNPFGRKCELSAYRHPSFSEILSLDESSISQDNNDSEMIEEVLFLFKDSENQQIDDLKLENNYQTPIGDGQIILPTKVPLQEEENTEVNQKMSQLEFENDFANNESKKTRNIPKKKTGIRKVSPKTKGVTENCQGQRDSETMNNLSSTINNQTNIGGAQMTIPKEVPLQEEGNTEVNQKMSLLEIENDFAKNANIGDAQITIPTEVPLQKEENTEVNQKMSQLEIENDFANNKSQKTRNIPKKKTGIRKVSRKTKGVTKNCLGQRDSETTKNLSNTIIRRFVLRLEKFGHIIPLHDSPTLKETEQFLKDTQKQGSDELKKAIKSNILFDMPFHEFYQKKLTSITNGLEFTPSFLIMFMEPNIQSNGAIKQIQTKISNQIKNTAEEERMRMITQAHTLTQP